MNLQITDPAYKPTQELFIFSFFLKLKTNKQKHFSSKGKQSPFFLCLLNTIVSHFFQCTLSLLSQSRCFPSTPSPPLHSLILRSAPDSPGTRTCKGSAPAGAHGGTGSDVARRTVPARPADVTAAAVPSEAQEWEFEGKHGGDPVVTAERCDCTAYFGFSGSSGRNGPCSAG